MKKIVILFALLIASTNAYCQSVLGIPFGSSYSVVKNKLAERYGVSKVNEINGSIWIYDLHVGGFLFDVGVFEFQRAGSATYFNRANFMRDFEESHVEEAERLRDYLYSLLKDKYESDGLYEIENDQGFMCYLFGKNPRDASSRLGCIYLSRDKGKDGKTRLYLSLSYGPIYYVDKASDF